MRLKRIIILFLMSCMLITSGCWDMIEIEKRALVGAIIIDLIEKEEEDGGEKKSSPFCEEKPNVIKVTFGVNNPSKLIGGGPGAAVPVSVKAANIPDAMEELGSRIPRTPFYGQIRLAIFTDKLVKNESVFREVLDEFQRKAVISETMRIAVFRGKPEEILNVEPKLENIQSLSITGIMENSRVLSNTISTTLNDLVSQLRNGEGTAVLPVLEIQKEEESNYVINKLALIKDYKLLNILDSKYVKSYKIITGELKSGRKLITYKGVTIPYYIFSSKRRIWLEDDKNGLKFRVKVKMEGDIEQLEFDKTLFDSKIIDDVKRTLEESTIKELEATTKYFQKDINHDFLGFKEYTNKYHYKTFKKYEKNWDEEFRNAKIVYEVESSIRRIGTSKK